MNFTTQEELMGHPDGTNITRIHYFGEHGNRFALLTEDYRHKYDDETDDTMIVKSGRWDVEIRYYVDGELKEYELVFKDFESAEAFITEFANDLDD
jgi:hypothetical protein